MMSERTMMKLFAAIGLVSALIIVNAYAQDSGTPTHRHHHHQNDSSSSDAPKS